MTAHGIGGTLERPAYPSSSSAARALHARRLGLAAAAAVAMHVTLLVLRPAGLGSHVTPSSPVMLVRMVRADAPLTPPATEAVEPSAAAQPQPIRIAAAMPEPAPRGVRAPRATSERRLAAVSASSTAPAQLAAPTAEAKSGDARLPPAPDYALGSRLDPGPRPLDDIDPDYPDTVHLREGTVVLRLLISDTGHVDDVAVVRSEPRGVFEQAALEAFGKARFAPGFLAGTPVKSQITIEVEFMPINRGARVSGRSY